MSLARRPPPAHGSPVQSTRPRPLPAPSFRRRLRPWCTSPNRPGSPQRTTWGLGGAVPASHARPHSAWAGCPVLVHGTGPSSALPEVLNGPGAFGPLPPLPQCSQPASPPTASSSRCEGRCPVQSLFCPRPPARVLLLSSASFFSPSPSAILHHQPSLWALFFPFTSLSCYSKAITVPVTPSGTYTFIRLDPQPVIDAPISRNRPHTADPNRPASLRISLLVCRLDQERHSFPTLELNPTLLLSLSLPCLWTVFDVFVSCASVYRAGPHPHCSDVRSNRETLDRCAQPPQALAHRPREAPARLCCAGI